MLLEYLQLWDTLQDINLQSDTEDTHVWHFTANGQYSVKTAYEAMFVGVTEFSPWERIWKTWAPPKCRFFMWLVACKRCWTADRLARRKIPHPESCPICDQVEESIDHLLVACVFSRQFWFTMLQQVDLHMLALQLNDHFFDSWWERTSEAASGLKKEGINSLIILGSWTLWNHRNRCVFVGEAPSMTRALMLVAEDHKIWSLAGARGLNLLTAPGLGT
jgi:hypothetical protein